MRYKTNAEKFTRWICALVIFSFMAFPPASVSASEASEVLRVPFTEMEGLMEKRPDGSYCGLVIDYLNEISKYTGWDYEYTDVEGDENVNEFIKGEYDLMGGIYYLPSLEKYFAYPDYSMGNSKSVLLAREDDHRIRSSDIRSLNGKTIGVYERAVENTRRLQEFLSMNNLDCTLKYYSYEQLLESGSLYPYLENGEIDLLLGNNTETDNSFRVAFSYDSQPYYIVTTPDRQDILDGLNMALEKIIESNPNFAQERYDANFRGASIVDVHLNEEELDYIEQNNHIIVALPRSFHPLSCPDEICIHNGLAIDVLEEISAFSGLEFSYVYTDTYSDAAKLLKQGDADILGFFLGSSEESAENDLVLTAPFASMNSIVIRNKQVNFPEKDLVGAVIGDRSLPADLPASEVLVYPNAAEALSAVNQGKADYVYGLASYLEFVLQEGHYVNVVPTTIASDRNDICLALPRPADPQLLGILNKSIYTISADKKLNLLDQNMVSTGKGSLTLEEVIYANPFLFIGIMSLILIIIVTAGLFIARARIKSAMIQGNLEKAEAESRAKGDFLSRMSHELRTPMNAVVGLTDLISMTEGLPEKARENLSKLRASSYYLLELINDILDSSRLDNGMLTIANEPFSLTELLDKIQDMTESGAHQRGLIYIVEKDIIHTDVSGDGIRLKQVLANLISNAFKFTPKGGKVILRVTETPSDSQSADYTFQVTDSGVGIAAEDQERIFELFEQVGTNYSQSQGTGLGLPISQKIVQLMGGSIRIRSVPGQGSEFYFRITLPFAAKSVSMEPANITAGPSKSLEGIHTLLAEDNDLNAEIAGELLKIQGMRVTRAENGRQAVDQFAAGRPNDFQVILMDIQMPEMNGLEASRTIRMMERPDAKSIPIIAMTANAFQEDADAAMAAGMDGFLSKPVDVEQLYSLLRSLLKD